MKKNITKMLSIILIIATIFSIGTIGLTASAVSSKNVGTAKTGTYYTIKNLGSNKMLNVYGSQNKNNANVTVYSNDGTTGQKVKSYSHGTMKYDGVTFTKYYFVFKCATSRALNVYGSTSKSNSNVCLWTISGNDTQDWILEYVPSKSGYIIRSANNPKYVLTATGSKNSSNVCLKAYSSSNDYQIWKSSMFAKSTSSNTSSGKTTNSNSSKIVSPVENRTITSAFQPYYRQDVSSSWAHSGIDYVSKKESVFAFCDGKVTETGYNNSVGYYIEIKHTVNNRTFYSYYFHLKKDSTKVSKNDSVSAGTVIAKIGNTGASYGAHLHFQITSGSVINSNGSFHVLPRDNSYKNWSEAKQSQIVSRTSSKNITFYNPEIVLTKGLSIITG